MFFWCDGGWCVLTSRPTILRSISIVVKCEAAFLSPPIQTRPRIADSSSPSPAPLTSLPVELILQILERLPDFSCLLSTILVYRSIYRVYKIHDRQILRTIFGRTCVEVQQYYIGQVFWELVFAIRHREFIRREIVEEFLTVGWNLF